MYGALLDGFLTGSRHFQAELQRHKAGTVSLGRQHQAELACKAADMAALARQHEAAQRQAADGFRAQLAAAEAQHAQQLQQAKEEARSQVLDTEERLQDVKDLLVALQARFNNRCLLLSVYPILLLQTVGPGCAAPYLNDDLHCTSALSRCLVAQHDFRR